MYRFAVDYFTLRRAMPSSSYAPETQICWLPCRPFSFQLKTKVHIVCLNVPFFIFVGAVNYLWASIGIRMKNPNGGSSFLRKSDAAVYRPITRHYRVVIIIHCQSLKSACWISGCPGHFIMYKHQLLLSAISTQVQQVNEFRLKSLWARSALHLLCNTYCISYR
jgi:hypothetical protein